MTIKKHQVYKQYIAGLIAVYSMAAYIKSLPVIKPEIGFLLLSLALLYLGQCIESRLTAILLLPHVIFATSCVAYADIMISAKNTTGYHITVMFMAFIMALATLAANSLTLQRTSRIQ